MATINDFRYPCYYKLNSPTFKIRIIYWKELIIIMKPRTFYPNDLKS